MSTLETEAEKMLVVALDFPDATVAYKFWQRLELPSAVCKIGLELLFSGGVELIRELAANGVRVFVDAKLFDIGNTVERATARIADLGAAYLTVHAQSTRTLRGAIRGRGDSALKLLGVTLLTDAKPSQLSEQGIAFSAPNLVLLRARLAAESGFDGIVSSPWEAKSIRENFGRKLTIVCPGIRPRQGLAVAGDDQARPATPADAIAAGADLIVVGRPILQADDPATAAREIVAEIASGLQAHR